MHTRAGRLAAIALVVSPLVVGALQVERPQKHRNHHHGRKPMMLNAVHRREGENGKEKKSPECGAKCTECRSDTDNPANAHCWECATGFGLEHDPQECRDMLNCVNECVPCTVSGCSECSTRASVCTACEAGLSLSSDGGSCSDGPAQPAKVAHKEKEQGNVEKVTDAASSGANAVGGEVTDAAGSVEDVGSTAAEETTDKVEGMNPMVAIPKVSEEIAEGNFENVHVLLNPATAVSGAMAAGGIIGYIILVCCCGFCYTKVKSGYLNDWEGRGRLPNDGFSDNIFAWNTSICFWSCCCPCIRWADTVSEMGYMKYVVALSIWMFLTLGNSLLMGCGTLILIGVGAWYRTKLRQSWGLPENTCQDVIAWCCCMPCAIAQEARHVERARSLNMKTLR